MLYKTKIESYYELLTSIIKAHKLNGKENYYHLINYPSCLVIYFLIDSKTRFY
jgi:hypothetical protein